MKKLNSLLALMLAVMMLLASCSTPSNNGNENNGGASINAMAFPESAFAGEARPGVIGSIIQTGDGNAYVNGTVPVPQTKSGISQQKNDSTNKHLVTFEHNFGTSCYVGGYIGKSLYVIEDFGSLAENKKGIGHKDGTIVLKYGENGYMSISSICEDKIIVGNPTEYNPLYNGYDSHSYVFGYMIYNESTKTIEPMYKENNLRFYTAGYFIDGVAQVSVKEGDKILFGLIDANGNYIVEPTYEMMADERIDGVVIVAREAEVAANANIYLDTCSRNIAPDSTLMTDVQKARDYECKSQSVGLLDTKTGKTVLPCSYSYIERVMDNIYFVIDNEGQRFLFDAKSGGFTTVESGVYCYFNSDWMLYVTDGSTAYLADKNFNLYETADLDVSDLTTKTYINATNRINVNVISAIRDQEAKDLAAGKTTILDKKGLLAEFDRDTSIWTLTVSENGDVINNVTSFAYPDNGGFLYTIKNTLYRYDMATRKSAMIETGYGNFTEDYNNWDATYCAIIEPLDDGIYVISYDIRSNDGIMHYRIIVNDKGVVLYDADINSISTLTKNYLGRYDDSLYELAGETKVEDNYLLTKNDGTHYLIQFVRGELTEGEGGASTKLDDTRVIDSIFALSLISPFNLDFKDGSDIEISICGLDIPSSCYAYNGDTQSLKILSYVVDYDYTILDSLITNDYLEITVKAGSETKILKIEVSPLSSDL